MRETDSRNGNHGDRSFLWEPPSPEPFSEAQLGFSLIITLLSPCRCVQLSAADVADGDLARIHGGSGARFQRGAVPAVLLALQGPPGEHHGAAEKRERSFLFFYLHQIHLGVAFMCRFSLMTGRSVLRHHVQQSVGEQQEWHRPGVHTHPVPGDLWWRKTRYNRARCFPDTRPRCFCSEKLC